MSSSVLAHYNVTLPIKVAEMAVSSYKLSIIPPSIDKIVIDMYTTT